MVTPRFFTSPENGMKPFGFYYSIYSCLGHKVVLRACFMYSAAFLLSAVCRRLNKPSARAQLQQQAIDWRLVTVWMLGSEHAGFSRWDGSCNLRPRAFCASTPLQKTVTPASPDSRPCGLIELLCFEKIHCCLNNWLPTIHNIWVLLCCGAKANIGRLVTVLFLNNKVL